MTDSILASKDGKMYCKSIYTYSIYVHKPKSTYDSSVLESCETNHMTTAAWIYGFGLLHIYVFDRLTVCLYVWVCETKEEREG